MPYAAASTIPFFQGPAIFPTGTTRYLSPNGFLMYASLPVPNSHQQHANPDFIHLGLPLHLSEFQVERRWEGQVASNVPEYVLRAAVARQFLELRIWFGTQSPSKKTLEQAQHELNSLGVPPAPGGARTHPGRCSGRPAPGLVVGRSSGRAGSRLAVAGLQLPGPNKIGQIRPPGKLEFWWNLDPSK